MTKHSLKIEKSTALFALLEPECLPDSERNPNMSIGDPRGLGAPVPPVDACLVGVFFKGQGHLRQGPIESWLFIHDSLWNKLF